MNLFDKSELNKLDLVELSALFNVLFKIESSLTDTDSINPVFITTQRTLLKMLKQELSEYVIQQHCIITDDNLIIRNLSVEKGN